MAESNLTLTVNLNLDHSDATMDLLAALQIMADSIVPIQPSEVVDLLEQWQSRICDEP